MPREVMAERCHIFRMKIFCTNGLFVKLFLVGKLNNNLSGHVKFQFLVSRTHNIFHYRTEFILAHSLLFGVSSWAGTTNRDHEKYLARISLISQQHARYGMPLIHCLSNILLPGVDPSHFATTSRNWSSGPVTA